MLDLTLMLNRVHAVPGMKLSEVVDLGRMAEDAGIHSVALGEHVALGAKAENYPYSRGLVRDHGTQMPYLDPIVVLSAIASATTRLRLATSILIAPLRPPVLMAKQLASLDVISNGRCDPAFGTGWNRDEYAALGVDFDRRRQLTIDCIGACRALWASQPATFHSDSVNFDGIYSQPMPVQRRIPLLVGLKATPRNAKVIAELCDGWDGGPDAWKDEAALRDAVALLRKAYLAAGRNPDDLIVRVYTPVFWHENGSLDVERSVTAAAGLRELGVNRVVFTGSALTNGARSIDDVRRVITAIGHVAQAC